MIGFYLTTTGEYSPEQVADISNSIILDDKNKTIKAMNQYVFEFLKLSADYENLTVDSSREGLSIYGAKAMYQDLYSKIPGEASFKRIEASINTLEEWQTVVNASVDTINSSISSLETWHDAVNTSIAGINSSISAIKTDYIPNASMGVNGGVATLDASGRVPSSQLPSYVDDIIEGYLYEGVFYEDAQHKEPITGEGGKIYVDLTTNTSWRWGGSAYTLVSKSLALGETDGTAYEGSKGAALKTAFDTHEASTAIHITADERTAWNNASDNSHTHDNKNVLDGITAGDITNFIDASNAKHTHTNAGILNGLTDTSISNWDDAATKAHEHTNKALLDGIADSSFHTHENKGILDRISADDVTNWNDASNAKHTHSNSAILNGITDASISAWDEGEANVNADWNATEGDASILNRPTLGDAAEKDVADVIKSSTGALVTDGAIKAYVDDTISKAHEHTNKGILDRIVDSSFHTHNNKSVLDGITSTDVVNWNDASNAKHTHSNSDILNGFTDASIVAFIQDTSYGQGSVQDLTTGTDTTPMVWDASTINAYVGQLDANAVRYKGDINAGTGEIVNTSDTLTSIANKKGDVYVVSTEGTLCGVDMQVGDSIIFKRNVAKGTAPVTKDLTFVQGTVKVTNEDATLQWGQLTKIANVEGVDISVGLPADPAIALNARIADVSAYAIEVSSYAEDVSSRLSTTDSTLTDRIENVSTYAINVSTNLADASSRLATVNATLTNRIENVSTYAINVSTYAANVSTNHANDVSAFNAHFAKVDASLLQHDSSIVELYDNTYELTQVWAAAWYDISTHFKLTDSSLDAHASDATVHITAAERTAWNGAANNSHNHSNKALLDGIADASFHTHTNKSILDGLNDTSVSNWNTAYGWGNHANAGYAQQSYAEDVSSRLATVNTTLTTRVQNVSTYAINVSTYAANVSTYAANVSTNLATDYQNSLNTAAMFMLANFAGLPTTLNSPEYKYVLTDVSSAVLLGKRQDDTWFFGDDTDTLMDAILDTYAQDDTLFSNMYRLSVAVSLARMTGDLSEISNPEYKWVILDSSSHVLMGIKQDNTWYLGATINEILDCTLDTYAVAGATQGTFDNKPTSPNVGQMYFATDKTASGGSNQGVPIWWNGTNWVDAIGNTVS